MSLVTDLSKSIAVPTVLIIGLRPCYVDQTNRMTRLIIDTLRGHGYGVRSVNMFSAANRDGRRRRRVSPAYKVVSGLRKWRHVLSAIRRHDVIQFDFDLAKSSVVSALILLAASGFFGKRSVLAVSSVSNEAVTGLRGLIMRRILRTPNAIVAGSDAAARYLRRFSANVNMIPQTACAHESAIRRGNGLQPRVGLVAPIDPTVFGSVVRSLTLVKQKYPRAELVIMANCRQAGEIQTHRAHSSLNGVDVAACNRERQVVQALSTCDVYLETSSQVDPPSALIEALVLGMPVVSTDTAGTANSIKHGVTGLVVAAGNHVDLANRLCELVETPELARTLSAGALALARQYDRSTVSVAWAQLYAMVSPARQVTPDWSSQLSPQYQATVKA